MQLYHLEDGAYFGELALVLDEPRVTTVTAITPCETFKLKKSSFFRAIENYPDVKEKVFSIAQSKVISTNVDL